MTREETEERIKVMQAFVDGKDVEVLNTDKWELVSNPSWSPNTKYRIKPEPKYRPFKDADECLEEMKKHEPLGWLKMKSNDGDKVFVFVRGIHKYIKDNSNTCDICIDNDLESSIYIFGEYTFADGTPFGVKMEE